MFDIAIFVTATVATGILMTWRMSKIPGIALLERNIGHRRPDYRDHRRLTSAFLRRLTRGAANPVAIEKTIHRPESEQERSIGNLSSATRRPRVFYDGGCPLCRREIEHYRRIDRQQRLVWVDITRQSDALRRNGLSYGEAMARFHVLDSSGRWHTGAHGFAELWSHLPYFRWLARATRGLGLLVPLDYLYRHFTRWRASRRCSEGLCSNKESET